jgi:16S rRNA G966 N2-methylase RsmD
MNPYSSFKKKNKENSYMNSFFNPFQSLQESEDDNYNVYYDSYESNRSSMERVESTDSVFSILDNINHIVKEEKERTKSTNRESVFMENVDEGYMYQDIEEQEKKEIIEPKIITNIDLSIFFDKSDIEKVKDYNKLYNTNNTLKITDVGIYSISKYMDAQWITNVIEKHYESYYNKKIDMCNIIDGTAGIGGNMLSFVKKFFHVYGVELNKTHYKILQENLIGALHMENKITLHEGNVLEYYKNYKDDKNNTLFFIDPPWGGRRYKQYKNFMLKIGKHYIQDFIEELYLHQYPYVILKAPINLNVNIISNQVSYQNISIFKTSNMMLVIFYN